MCPEYERSKMITIEYPAIEKRLWAIWSSEMNLSLKWHINWELKINDFYLYIHEVTIHFSFEIVTALNFSFTWAD